MAAGFVTSCENAQFASLCHNINPHITSQPLAYSRLSLRQTILRNGRFRLRKMSAERAFKVASDSMNSVAPKRPLLSHILFVLPLRVKHLRSNFLNFCPRQQGGNKSKLPLQLHYERRRHAQYFQRHHLGFPISSLVLKYITIEINAHACFVVFLQSISYNDIRKPLLDLH